jgi:chromosome segregation ATPase/SAM-dependent methyltransferase
VRDLISTSLELIGSGARNVLFVGRTASGIPAAIDAAGYEITAVLFDDENLDEARVLCSTVEVTDPRATSLPPNLGLRSFDVIVFDGALEHFYEPWHILEDARKLLRSNGFIVAVMPNIFHGALRVAPLKGPSPSRQFATAEVYRGFTMQSAFEIVTRAGYGVDSLERVEQAESEQSIQENAIEPEARTRYFLVKTLPVARDANDLQLQRTGAFAAGPPDVMRLASVQKIDFPAPAEIAPAAGRSDLAAAAVREVWQRNATLESSLHESAQLVAVLTKRVEHFDSQMELLEHVQEDARATYARLQVALDEQARIAAVENERRISELAASDEQHRNAVAALQEALSAAERAIEKSSAERDEARAQLTQLQSRIDELHPVIAAAEFRATQAEEATQHARTALESHVAESARRIVELEGGLRSGETLAAELRAAHEDRARELFEARAENDRIWAERSHIEAAAQELHAQFNTQSAAFENRVAELQAALDAQSVQLSAAENAAAHLQEKLDADSTRVTSKIAELTNALDERSAELNAVGQERDRILAESNADRTLLESRIAALSGMLEDQSLHFTASSREALRALDMAAAETARLEMDWFELFAELEAANHRADTNRTHADRLERRILEIEREMHEIKNSAREAQSKNDGALANASAMVEAAKKERDRIRTEAAGLTNFLTAAQQTIEEQSERENGLRSELAITKVRAAKAERDMHDLEARAKEAYEYASHLERSVADGGRYGKHLEDAASALTEELEAVRAAALSQAMVHEQYVGDLKATWAALSKRSAETEGELHRVRVESEDRDRMARKHIETLERRLKEIEVLEHRLTDAKTREAELSMRIEGLENTIAATLQSECALTRAEAGRVETLVDVVQSSHFWRLKHWLRRLAGRS